MFMIENDYQDIFSVYIFWRGVGKVSWNSNYCTASKVNGTRVKNVKTIDSKECYPILEIFVKIHINLNLIGCI